MSAREASDAYVAQMVALIAEHGFTVQGVFDPLGERDAVSYTVGMTVAGLPELWVGGMDPRMASGILNRIGALQMSKAEPLVGEVDVDYSVPFRVTGPVDPESAEVFLANRLYPHPMLVEVRQVLWPDEAGRFPGDDGYDADRFPQPLLPARGQS